MGYVPGCRYDLFISYASENNREAWVEQFEGALGQELGDLLGRQFDPKASIFFDKRDLEVGQNFSERIRVAARDSAILVPVLSPGYLTSGWCNRERTEFFSRLPQGAVPADCLAPVLVRPIDDAVIDKLYSEAQRLSFLGADGQTPLAVGSPQWCSQLKQLALQLKHALQALRKKCPPVYLGKVSESGRLETLREWCGAELQRRCFRTVPEFLPALDDADQVCAHLQDAGLAIHFLGNADAATLDAMETSVGVCPGPTILYQPFGAEVTAIERLWLSDFERGLQAEPGRYQRLTGKNDQELFAVIEEHIAQTPSHDGAGTTKPAVALVCEEVDLDSARLFQQELERRLPASLAFPAFLESRPRSMERLRKWVDLFNRTDAQLFYFGAADRERLELLWQLAQQSSPRGSREWFVASPDVDDKRRKYPEALWTLDQVVDFAGGGARRAEA
jgi:hypothetical protein